MFSVRLSKRRKVGPGASAVAKSRLIVRHRPLTDQEIAAQVSLIVYHLATQLITRDTFLDVCHDLTVYVVVMPHLLFLLYQPLTRTYLSVIVVTFGIPGHVMVTTKHLTSTPRLIHQKVTQCT